MCCMSRWDVDGNARYCSLQTNHSENEPSVHLVHNLPGPFFHGHVSGPLVEVSSEIINYRKFKLLGEKK